MAPEAVPAVGLESGEDAELFWENPSQQTVSMEQIGAQDSICFLIFRIFMVAFLEAGQTASQPARKCTPMPDLSATTQLREP